MARCTAITGATGHVGGNLVRALLARGDSVRCLVHEDDRAIRGLDVERCEGDVRKSETLRPLLDGADRVFHLAAIISIDGDRGGLVQAVNIDGTRNVAIAALDAGVRRFVHCCSVHAFDQAPLDEPVDETRLRATGPRHLAYDRSKAAGEAAVREVVARGLDAVIVHPSGVIGPYDFKRSRMGQVLLDLFRRKLVALVPGGFDWVDVRDVVGGMLAAAEQGRTNESYVLSGHWHSVCEIAAMAEAVTGVPAPRITAPLALARIGAPFVTVYHRVFGGEPLFTNESLDALQANRNLVHDKATRELGYAPRPIADSIRDAYAWFEETGHIRVGSLQATL